MRQSVNEVEISEERCIQKIRVERTVEILQGRDSYKLRYLERISSVSTSGALYMGKIIIPITGPLRAATRILLCSYN